MTARPTTGALPSGKRGRLVWDSRMTAFPDANRSFAKAMSSLANLFPYFEADSYTLTPVWVQGLGTVAITAQRVLLLDPAIVAKWARKAFGFALAHELMHLFVNTHGRAPLGADGELWNLASDAEINDDLAADKRAEWPWPPVTPQSLRLQPHLTAEAYYAALVAKHQPPEGGKGGGTQSTGQPGGGKPKCACGTGAGNAGDDDIKGLSDELDKIFGRGEEEQAADRLALAEAMDAAEQKSQGSVPAGFLRHVKALKRPPVTRWQDKLSHSMRRKIANRPGGKATTYRSPNRRQAGVGYGAGRPVLSTSRDIRPTVWVAIDTSGSMGVRELSEGITEARHVMRAAGAKVVFLSCDAEVHTMTAVDEHTDLGALLKGGGGTSFIPVFDKAVDERAKGQRGAPPDLIVFFTDLYGSFPAEDPGLRAVPGMKTIWLVSGKGAPQPPFGQCIQVPMDGAEASE